jgi:membrane-associated phospholipid phosphatase
MRKCCISFFCCLLIVSAAGQNADITILKSINKGRNRQLDGMFRGITNSATPASIALPVLVLSAGLIGHDSLTTRKGLVIATSILLAAGISTGLKYSVKRTRPYVTYPYIEKATSGGSPSFPSGHTSDAFATATSFSLAFPKWYVVVPSYLWACSVGYSRMHLGVHYPGDVVGGAIVGAGTSFLCYKANQWIRRRGH